ncbi:MAG: hypothetical protein U0791_26910 [Gemmataceae bacterium]
MLPLYPRTALHLPVRRRPDHPRFHLEGVEAGRHISVYRIQPDSGDRLDLLASAVMGEGDWVDLREPIIVQAGEAFVAVTDAATAGGH